jgi:hypothetical protein
MKPAVHAFARVWILLALAMVEALGLVLLRGQAFYFPFAVFSLWAVLLAVPILWIEALWRHGISFIEIAFISGFGLKAIQCFRDSDMLYGYAFAAISIFLAIRTANKFGEPTTAEEQEASLRALRHLDARLPAIALYNAGVIACLVMIPLVVHRPGAVFWIIPIVLLMLWFAWRLVFTLFIKKRNADDAEIPAPPVR